MKLANTVLYIIWCCSSGYLAGGTGSIPICAVVILGNGLLGFLMQKWGIM